MHARLLVPALLLAATAGCDAPSDTAPADAPADAPVAHAPPPRPSTVEAWALPAPDGAAQPDLVTAPDGSLLLSWIEPSEDGHALRFARHGADGWSAARTIATGGDWFVNWADTPHLAATADGALWAHWLRKSAAATYAYDVVLSRSGDGGATWSAPVAVNQDGTPTEHGFVALWPADEASVAIAWLDGRDTAVASDGHGGHGAGAGAGADEGGADGHGGGGMMTLRTARFDAGLARHDETRLDASTCDCCQTAAAATADGHVVAYRDRTSDEIRDISVVRGNGGEWSRPARVHADDWTMPACPVNGPSLAARGDTVLVAWYTAAGDVPRVRVAASADGGATFRAPVEVDAGDAVQGRLAAALGEDGGWLAWLREGEEGQALQLARFDPATDALGASIEVARLSGRGRGTGFPQLALAGDRAHLAWTEVVDGKPRLRGAVVSR